MNHRKPTTASKIRAALRRFSVPLAVTTALFGAGLLTTADAAVKPDCKTLSYPLCNRSVAAAQVVDNSLPKSKIVPADRDAFLKDTNTPDVKGGAEPLFVNVTPKVIADIGGTFSTRHTPVGTFVLPKGTWLVNLNAKFSRTTGYTPAEVAAANYPDVQPMLQIVGGSNYVTVMGNSIAPNVGADLTGSAVGLITVSADTTFTINAFGYNSARGSQGSGEITAQAVVVAVRA